MNEWINVTDALPDPHELVIIYEPGSRNDMRVTVGYVCEDGWWRYLNDSDVRTRITHWMPFPKPPGG